MRDSDSLTDEVQLHRSTENSVHYHPGHLKIFAQANHRLELGGNEVLVVDARPRFLGGVKPEPWWVVLTAVRNPFLRNEGSAAQWR